MDDLDMRGSDPRLDLTAVLAAVPLTSLSRLKRAHAEGRLIRGQYRVGALGCLLHFLTGVTSKEELLAHDFGRPDLLLAARRLVRHHDSGEIPDGLLRWALAAAIRHREKENNPATPPGAAPGRAARRPAGPAPRRGRCAVASPGGA
ncbi:MAG: hypothetical protein L0Z62_05665 [Gemmataceae bacterium]|nr:hypothetical protein [Gemmataceae bacterium]